MRHVEDRQTAQPLEPADLFEQRLPLRLVEIREWLVHQQDARLRNDRPGDRQPLTLAP